MKIIRNFSRLFVGLVFIYSGFVKVADPMGFAYKFEEYFEAMGLIFLSDAALTFAILLCVAELLIGIALTFNLLTKIASWAVLIFMLLMTPLTLWLALTNAVTDCGCFGDAVILSNWDTFLKNVIIDVFVVIIFLNRKKYKSSYNILSQWILGIIFAISAFSLSIYCLKYLPIIDFRPYHIGANIKDGMTIPESQKDNIPVYKSIFIYEKDGVKKEFDAKDSPVGDPSWKFIDAKHNVVKKGYQPPIHDFSIIPVFIQGITPMPEANNFVNLYSYEFIFTNNETQETQNFTIDMLPDNSWNFEGYIALYNSQNIDLSQIKLIYNDNNGNEKSFDFNNRPSTEEYNFFDAEYIHPESNMFLKYGEDITDEILADNGYTFLLTMTYIEKANTKNIEQINKIAEFCAQHDYKFLCLTASNEETIKNFITQHNLSFNFFNTDPTTLKTMIRSNPGLILMKNGTILKMWSNNNLPNPESNDLLDNLESKSISKIVSQNENKLTVIFILSVLLFISLLKLKSTKNDIHSRKI